MLDGQPPQWIIGILGVLIGIGLGSIFTYLLTARGNRSRHLQVELDQLKMNFQDYRDQVTHHFMRTSELVQEMTQSYRSVYEHLASGAQQLCGEANNPALGHRYEPRPVSHEAEEILADEDIGYDEYAELSRIRQDIDELLGEASQYPENTGDPVTEKGNALQH